MRIIKIEKTESGAHCNQTIDHLSKIPVGWAVIPEDMVMENFPFGDVIAEEIYGEMVVTSWIPREVPEPTPAPTPEPSTDDVLNTLLGVIE